MKLEDIYTIVKVLPQSLAKNFTDAEGIQKLLRSKKALEFDIELEKKTKISGVEVANKYQYLTVLGEPGSGKSTLLRKIGLDAIKGILEFDCMPIFIELKRFRNPEDIDLNKIISESFHSCNCPQAEKLIEAGLKQGKFIVLLDGLDEVPNKTIEEVVRKTRKFIKENENNRFIISCRTAAYHQEFPEFNGVIITEFDEPQIKQFIYNWFSSDTDKRAKTAAKCLAKLAENEGAKDLAKTPLLLTFICLVYDESQTLPKNISELYKQALVILLEKWSAEKRLPRDPIYQNFTTQLEIMLLAQIAYEGFVVDKLLFSTEELVTKIKEFLACNLNAPQDLDGKAVLNAIAVQQGILTERLDSIYSFSHLTLQEYLTAKYIVDNDLIETTVEQYVTDSRWKEVFILIAGLMEGKTGADKLILSLETQALSYLQSLQNKGFLWRKHRFIRLLEWAERKTLNSPANLSSTAKRVVAIAFANIYIYARANTYANANVYDKGYAKTYTNDHIYVKTIVDDIFIDYFLQQSNEMLKLPSLFFDVNLEDLKNQLEAMKNEIPDNRESRKVHREFAQHLIKTWLNAFGLTLDMINLSNEEIEEIDSQYFYVYHLILRCKDSAVLVTEATWREVEERMYRVISNQ